MKGIILAGGKGSRLAPLTEVTNKHLLPVGKEPMIWHSVKQFAIADIRDILVVTSTSHMGDVVNSLGSGKRFGCELTYRVQEKPNGIAGALALGEQFARGEKIIVLLGDNIFEYSIRPHIEAFAQQIIGSRVLLKEVGDPERFAVAALDEKRIIEIEEKPKNPKTNYAVVGCYMYDDRVFDFIRKIDLSDRGEFEITAVNDLYRQQNQLEFSFVCGQWADAGTFQSLGEANHLLLSNNNKILS
ncbi:NTP transferase domain-containing protein [Lusitaniella coriacea LEGE 07157]|uniref:Glucose-1-phosphate thymidylyltransferase n=1 Tax=Lusitaniella coriacea LEGE 07157 TaxID=945747 RepID=A0A8J7DZU4_9CYAN|nr:sugar phosphate nucleotidyltransferase [Lusitaniella coriacea]MBE9116801.1 NTP transferase domain-containing protein [Lusitaniella coriacea LEGE 07157]